MNRKMRDYTEIKSSLRGKIRSRPKVTSATTGYLDLFLLNQEKTRMEQELRTVNGKLRILESSLLVLQKSIEETEKELLLMKAGTGKNPQKAPDNPYKAMCLEY